ncbi:hypothetical protein Agub_g2497, partial [Astrephomene gubernaculifera]
MRFRAPSVVQQDAVTHIATSCSASEGSAAGYVRLAVAQANQLLRIVPYMALRRYAEARRAARMEAAEVDEEAGCSSNSDDDGDSVRGATGDDGNVHERRNRHNHRRHNCRSGRDNGRSATAAAATDMLLPLDELMSCPLWPGSRSSNGSGDRCVVTLNTHQQIGAVGWDPRRPGRLALVDRCSPYILILELGSDRGGTGAAGSGGDYRRSYLTAESSDGGVIGAFGGGGVGIGGGGGAARALTYMKYGSLSAPYTMAAAGRASGEGAVVHLWDERRGRTPVSRLSCPGGAPLVTPLEAGLGGTALMGVVHPGTLVLWDVRRASSTTAGGALLSLGA